jgi:hypothetical protein
MIRAEAESENAGRVIPWVAASRWWDGELVSLTLRPSCPVLRKAQVGGIRWSPAADQAGLTGQISDVIAVTHPARLWESKDALIDSLGGRPMPSCGRPRRRRL